MKKHTECHCEHDHCEHEHEHHEHERHEHEHHEHEHHDCDCCGCGHDHGHSNEERESVKKTVLRYLLGAVPVILGFMSFIPFYIPLIASVVGYVIFGFECWHGMIKGFARKKIFTEFTLMCVATLGAFAIGEYADAAALMYLYSLGETISDGAYSRSKKSISELLEIAPEFANTVRADEIIREKPEAVGVGELILVRSGERIPLDGVVVSGGGYADTSSVTGEEKPLELYEGVECLSGSLLTSGTVTVKVLKEYENSVVARLRRAVEEAGRRKSSAEKKISRFAAVFTPLAFAVAVVVFAVGALITKNIAAWLKAAIMVLVVSCPCSLVLSVPLTYFAGTGYAAGKGIIFRGGEVMDRMARLGFIAFDKTGTVTQSALSFDGVTLFSETNENDFIDLAASVLIYSPHAAAVSFCREHTADARITVSDAENIGGRGIICVAEGKKAIFGNARLMEENGISAEHCERTCIYGAYDGRLLGRLEFSSRIKKDAEQTVKELYALGTGRIAMISGDSALSVSEVCESVGIQEFYSSCAPDEKLEIFEKISKEQNGSKKYSAYCGDGLNDSAVIAAADVGIAMGGCGSALTVESADVVLMDDSLDKINQAIRISRRTSRVANSNIVLSLGIKIGVLLLGVLLGTVGADIPIELAIVADVGAAIVAVLNALRAAKKEKI